MSEYERQAQRGSEGNVKHQDQQTGPDVATVTIMEIG